MACKWHVTTPEISSADSGSEFADLIADLVSPKAQLNFNFNLSQRQVSQEDIF